MRRKFYRHILILTLLLVIVPLSVFAADYVVNDPLFPEQWALCGDNGLNAEAVWKKQTGSKDLVIAVVDSGIDFSHEDLQDKAVVLKKTSNVTEDNVQQLRFQHTFYGTVEAGAFGGEFELIGAVADHPDVQEKYNLPSNSIYAVTPGVPTAGAVNAEANLKCVPDHYSHGTHVASIIAAQTNNAKGVAGLARDCKIAAFAVANVGYAPESQPEGSKNIPVTAFADSDISALVEALNEVVAQKKAGLNIQVVNVSAGRWENEKPTAEHPLYKVLKAVSDNDIVICVAVGNEKQNIENPTEDYEGQYCIPCRFKDFDDSLNMITVGVMDKQGNFGAKSSNYSPKYVDILAPGADIYGAISNYIFDAYAIEKQGDIYYANCIDLWSKGGKKYIGEGSSATGTSYAAPYATAAVALVRSQNPKLTAAETVKLICDNADAKHTDKVKYGVLNVEKTLEATPAPSNGSSGGCNGGFGEIALLFIAVIPLAKRYGKKAA